VFVSLILGSAKSDNHWKYEADHIHENGWNLQSMDEISFIHPK